MKEAAGSARNAPALAMSCGSPYLPTGGTLAPGLDPLPGVTVAAARAVLAACRGVLTGPGQTALTVIPCGASSAAIDWVRPTTANFDAQYAAIPGNPLTA